jgi:hypothetical protein
MAEYQPLADVQLSSSSLQRQLVTDSNVPRKAPQPLTSPSASSPAALLPTAIATHGTKLIRLLALRSMPAGGRTRRRRQQVAPPAHHLPPCGPAEDCSPPRSCCLARTHLQAKPTKSSPHPPRSLTQDSVKVGGHPVEVDEVAPVVDCEWGRDGESSSMHKAAHPARQAGAPADWEY